MLVKSVFLPQAPSGTAAPCQLPPGGSDFPILRLSHRFYMVLPEGLFREQGIVNREEVGVAHGRTHERRKNNLCPGIF